MYSLSMVVPAYNEDELLEVFVRKSMVDLSKITDDFEIILVNDGSTDRTPEIAGRLTKEFKNLRVINLEKNSGVGVATKTGLMAASKEIVFNNTVDAFFNMEDLPLLLKYLPDYDIVSGYRTNLKSNNIYGKLLTLGNYYLIRLLFGLNLKAFQTVQFFRNSFLQSIKIEADSTFMAPELLIKAHNLGKSIKEVGIEYQPRRAGKGKCGNPKNILRTIKDIFKFWFSWQFFRKSKIIFLIFFISFSFLAYLFIYFRWTWYDEISDLYIDWFVVKAGMPYRDVFAVLPPFSYYVYGVFQHLFGPSFYVGRIESAFFYFLLLILIFKLVAKLEGKIAGFIAAVLIFTNFYMGQFFFSGVPYALVLFLIIGSIYTLTLNLKPIRKIVLATFLMSLVVLTRTDMIIPLLILLVWILRFQGKKLFLAALITAGITIFLVLFPFLHFGFSATFYQLFTYPSSIHFHFDQSDYSFFRKYVLFRLEMLGDILSLYYFTFLFLLAGLIIYCLNLRKSLKSQIQQLFSLYKIHLLLASVFLGLLLTQYLRSSFTKPATLYFMTFGHMLAAIAITRLYPKMKDFPGKMAIALLIAGTCLTSFIGMPYLKLTSPLKSEDTDIKRMERAALIVEKFTKPEDKIFTLDAPFHVYLAKRKVIFPLNTSTYLLSQSEDTQRVRENYQFNLEMVEKWLSGEADVVLICRDRERYLVFGKEFLDTLELKLKENYKLAAAAENAYPRGLRQEFGILEIYLAKNND